MSRARALAHPVLAVLLVGAVALGLVLSAAAQAGTHRLDFDSLPTGAPVGSGPAGLSMPQGPVVFDALGRTASTPNALRRAGDCPNAGANCTSGDHRLQMNFASPARRVSMRVGTVVPKSCFELDCPTVRLVGYDRHGAVVAENVPSPEIVTAPTITHDLSIEAQGFSIAKAVFVVSGDPLTGVHLLGEGHQYTAQVDNLTYEVHEVGDPPPPPPPTSRQPRIRIDSPRSGETFASTDINVKGHVVAPNGLSRFCVIANGPASFPDECNRAATVSPDGNFSVYHVPGMRPGPNTIRVWARDSLGDVGSASVRVSVANGDVDFITKHIEINQGVQLAGAVTINVQLDENGQVVIGRTPGEPLVATYDGVPLSEDKTTIVRLYGAARGAAGAVRGTTAFLWGFLELPSGRMQPLSGGQPLRPHASPLTLTANPNLARLRADDGGSFNFVLPSSWTKSRGARLKLVGEVAPPSTLSPGGDCCPDNNRLGLRDIPFSETRTVTLYPIGLIDRSRPDAGPRLPLTESFSGMKVLWPGRVIVAPPFANRLDVTSTGNMIKARNLNYHATMIARLAELYDDAPLHGKLIGLMGGGSCAGEGHSRIAAFDTNCASYMTIVAHEAGHTIGLRHSHSLPGGRECSEVHPGSRGPIRGIGLDTRLWSGSAPGRLRPIGAEQAGTFEAVPRAPAEVFDYMSYCGNSWWSQPFPARNWVSTLYWANTLRELRPGGRLDLGFSGRCCYLGGARDPSVAQSARRRTGRAPRQPILRIGAELDPNGGQGQIIRVEPGRGVPRDYGAGGDGSPASVVVSDRAGSVISRTEVRTEPATDSAASELLDAAVPSGPSAARLEIYRGGKLLARRSASSSPPIVKLRQPRRRGRLGKGKLAVRWSASDPDGDSVTSRVEFSSDGGRTWRGLAAGIKGGAVRLGTGSLPRTRKGIVRVVVSDGFNVARSQVGGIRVRGSGPKVSITTPERGGLAVLGDTNLRLEGQAFDDRGRPLAARRLRWVSKGRVVGRGVMADAPVYRLGGEIRLVATDYAGRRGADRLKLEVRKVSPLLTKLRAKRLGRQARRLGLRLASTLPGRVTIAGRGVKRRRARIGPRVRGLGLELVGKRRSRYWVRLTLTAGGRRTQATLSVRRAGRRPAPHR